MPDQPTIADTGGNDTLTTILKKISQSRNNTELRHFAAVGAVASSWAGFEMIIDISALELGEISQEPGFCLTAQVIGPARKWDAYIAVARFRGATRFLDQLNSLSRETSTLSERRNRVVHDVWYFFNAEKTPHRLEVTARRILRNQLVPTATESVLQLMQDIHDHAKKFLSLHDEIMASINT
ncbi:MAG: hypothetical protein ACREFK_05685 [Stellaceae bacterium]